MQKIRSHSSVDGKEGRKETGSGAASEDHLTASS
jgi:hypothetical protein